MGRSQNFLVANIFWKLNQAVNILCYKYTVRFWISYIKCYFLVCYGSMNLIFELFIYFRSRNQKIMTLRCPFLSRIPVCQVKTAAPQLMNYAERCPIMAHAMRYMSVGTTQTKGILIICFLPFSMILGFLFN